MIIPVRKKDDERLFIRVSMFPATFPGREVHDKNGNVGVVFYALEDSYFRAGWGDTVNVDGFHWSFPSDP
jgi:hypothetical protein